MSDAPVTVAYLGPSGTFSELAVDRYFGPVVEKRPVTGIDDVFHAVEQGEAQHGVVPVENSTEGAVTITQECLIDTRLSICGEVYLPIMQHLLVADRTRQTPVRRIVSHRQSLAQCRHWLREHYPDVEQVAVSSNAEAARMAAADAGVGAIAGNHAAERFGLEVLHSGIQDRSNNTTRFLVLGYEPAKPTGKDKSSILVYTENRPGSLLRVLEPFDRHQVSLTKIETRPSRDGIWAYVFFIDFEGHLDDGAVRDVFAELENRTIKIHFLGSYAMADSEPGARTASDAR
ncbi:MAG: prephenate dehydratase [Pseudohongiellaceae bacterium]